MTLAQGETYQKVCEILHLNGTVEFSVPCNLFLIFLYIAKNSFQFFLQKSLYHFVYTNQFHTAASLMKKFVKRDYEYYLNARLRLSKRSLQRMSATCMH